MIGTETTELGKSVLIVDPSEDNREVLGTALRRRGLQILEATEVQQGLQLARKHQPEVIVLDLETVTADDAKVQSQYDAETSSRDGSLVVLGTAKRENLSEKRQVVAKPYHYAPLIRTIEELASR